MLRFPNLASPLVKSTLFVCTLVISSATFAQVKEPTITNAEWEQPYQPFRIVGNLYYVGSYDLASYLITTSKGHILVNTGVASSAEAISKNIAALGFKVSDVKILLTNQAHYDHMGGMAGIQQMSGAKMMADKGDAKVIEDGGQSDYIFGGHGSMFQPVKVDRILDDGDEIELGGTKLTMYRHPGHTKGACSYLVNIEDDGKKYAVLLANIPTMLEEVNPAGMQGYENVGKDFEYTYAAMPKMKFDLWLAAHTSQFNLHKKHKEGGKYDPEAFRDRKGYDKQIAKQHKNYLEKKNSQSK